MAEKYLDSLEGGQPLLFALWDMQNGLPEQPQKKPQKKQQKAKKKGKAKKVLKPATFEDFATLDFRVGEFKEVWKHPKSDKLYCEKIDMGNNEIREIASGVQKFYKAEDITG